MVSTTDSVLRIRRTQLGLSQAELAHLAGLHRNQVSNIERGRCSPRWPTACRIAGALACDPQLLFPINSEAPADIRGSAKEAVDVPDRRRAPD